MTVTVRISGWAKRMLEELSARKGKKIRELVDEAVELYRRHVFLEEVNQAFAALRADPKTWSEEQAERELWETTLGDGLEDG
jgi:hypothetical protein